MTQINLQVLLYSNSNHF